MKIRRKIIVILSLGLILFGSFRFSSFAQDIGVVGIELPEELIPAYEQLNDLIQNETDLLTKRTEDLTKYENISSNTKYNLESDLSDMKTRLSQIENNLKNPENADNFTQVIIDSHSQLFQFNENLKEKNIEHRKAIENDIFKHYLRKHKQSLDNLNQTLISEDAKEIDLGKIEERYTTVTDVIGELEDEYLESTWVRFEEKVKQLKETIDEYLEN